MRNKILTLAIVLAVMVAAVLAADLETISPTLTGDWTFSGGQTWTSTADTDDETLTSSDSGQIFHNNGDTDNQVFTLPTAAAGLWFVFADVEAAAGADLYVQAAAGDKIENGTANEYYACKDDAYGSSITVVAIDATEWVVIAEKGTWVADDTPD